MLGGIGPVLIVYVVVTWFSMLTTLNVLMKRLHDFLVVTMAWGLSEVRPVAGLASLGRSWRTGLRFQAAVLKTLDESKALEPVTGSSGS